MGMDREAISTGETLDLGADEGVVVARSRRPRLAGRQPPHPALSPEGRGRRGQAMKPRSRVAKVGSCGKMALSCASVAPNHRASVAPYCASEVLGSMTPRVSA